jgi:hypothetical protein
VSANKLVNEEYPTEDFEGYQNGKIEGSREIISQLRA